MDFDLERAELLRTIRKLLQKGDPEIYKTLANEVRLLRIYHHVYIAYREFGQHLFDMLK